jgi:hypothetical protein
MDRTLQDVERHLAAMGCQHVQVGVREPVLARMILRHWTREELSHYLSWLKHENAQGSDVYVVPDEPTALVLLDDLTEAKLSELLHTGLPPCCVVETSPENYQAWIRLAEQPLDPQVLSTTAKLLAHRYQGDPCSASWKHFGRLAGFTNRKPKHRDSQGRQPFVKLREATGEVAPRGLEVVQEATRPVPKTPRPAPIEHRQYARQRFQVGMAKLRDVYGARFDASIADFKVAHMMAKEGYTHSEIADAMRLESPDIAARKGVRIESYIELTVRNAMKEAR